MAVAGKLDTAIEAIRKTPLGSCIRCATFQSEVGVSDESMNYSLSGEFKDVFSAENRDRRFARVQS